MPPEERRKLLVAAALPLLLERGEMVTTRQIADAAGVAEGTIFRVFADKDELIAAVVDAALDRTNFERDITAIDAGQPLTACVEQAVEVVQRRVVDLSRLLSSVGTRFHDRARQPTTDSDALTALFECHRDELGIEPRTAARLLRSLTLAATHPMMMDEPFAAADITALFLHGASSRGTTPC